VPLGPWGSSQEAGSPGVGSVGVVDRLLTFLRVMNNHEKFGISTSNILGIYGGQTSAQTDFELYTPCLKKIIQLFTINLKLARI